MFHIFIPKIGGTIAPGPKYNTKLDKENYMHNFLVGFAMVLGSLLVLILGPALIGRIVEKMLGNISGTLIMIIVLFIICVIALLCGV